jgi:2-phosphoglycolate phosphatase, prokaryotic
MARIVFDLDGTLIDSAPDIHGIANALLDAEGLPPITLDQTRSFVGSGAAAFIARLRAARGLPETDQPRLLQDFLSRYDGAVHLTHPYPGAAAALDALAGAGHRLGLCTNKPASPARAVLRHLALEDRFDVLIGGDSLPVRKPDPHPLHAAFAALGEGPCLFVGDSEIDAETAQRAGVPLLLFTEGYRKTPVDRLPHARAFDDFRALPDLVAELLTAA